MASIRMTPMGKKTMAARFTMGIQLPASVPAKMSRMRAMPRVVARMKMPRELLLPRLQQPLASSSSLRHMVRAWEVPGERALGTSAHEEEAGSESEVSEAHLKGEGNSPT